MDDEQDDYPNSGNPKLADTDYGDIGVLILIILVILWIVF